MKRKDLYQTSEEEDFAEDQRDDPGKTELSEDRTSLALVRSVLASERSLSGWIRTGISAELGGLAVAKLLPNVEPDWIASLVGGLFLAVGLMCYGFGIWRYKARLKRLVSTDEDEIVPARVILIVTFVLLVSTVLAGYLLFTE